MGESDNSPSPFLPFATWGRLQQILICIFIVGINSVWRLPYCIYKYSGLFLVAYYVMMALTTGPLCWIQIRLGQIYRKGLISMFSHFLPGLKGVAFLLLMWAFIQGVYNSVLQAQCIAYCFSIMTSGNAYPWEIRHKPSKLSSSGVIFLGRTPAEHYYYNQILDVTGASFPWPVLLAYLLVICCTCLPLMKSARSVGWVVYVSCPLSLVMLVSLMLYSLVALPGAGGSVADLFLGRLGHDKNSSLTTGHALSVSDVLQSPLNAPRMWIDALDVNLVGLGVWTGLLTTVGAHSGNSKRTRYIPIVALLGFTLIPYVIVLTLARLFGSLTQKQQGYLRNSLQPGLNLLFVSIPDAVSNLGVCKAWTCLLYLGVFLISMHYQVLLVLTIKENLIETLPARFLSKLRHPAILVLILTGLMLLLGTPQLTMIGMKMMQVLDLYLYRLLFIVVVMATPVFLIAYVRVNPLYMPIERWAVVGMCALAAVSTFIIELYREAEIRTPRVIGLELAPWQNVIGHMVSIATLLLCLIGGFVHSIMSCDGTPIERLRKVLKPNTEDLRSSPCFFDSHSDHANSGIVVTHTSSNSDSATDVKTETSVEIAQSEGKVDSV